MKKLFSFLVLSAAILMLPQIAQADINYPQQPSTIKKTAAAIAAVGDTYIKFTETAGKIAYIDLTLVGNWSSDDIKALEFRMKEGGSSTFKHLKNNEPEATTANTENGKKKILSNYGKTGSSKVDLRFPIIKNGTLDSCCLRIVPTAALLETLGADKYFQIGISGQAGANVKVEGNIMSCLYAQNCTTSTALRPHYFYRFFTTETATGSSEDNSNNFTIDCSALRLPTTTLQEACYQEMFAELGSHLTAAPTSLPATELVADCYNGMFKNCSAITSTPTISALRLTNDCGTDITDCCKEMFSGCSALNTVTTNFVSWGNGTGSASPTYNWITSTNSLSFRCPSSLAEIKDANHMGANGTKNATVNPRVYVFDVATNGGEWSSSCNGQKLYTTAAPSVGTPTGAGGGAFIGWYTAATDGSSVTPSSLSAPTGLNMYYAHFEAVAPSTYTITWMSENGSGDPLQVDADQAADAATAYNGNTPLKASISQYTYTFDGWTTAPNGGGTFYADGSTPAVSDDATYYAHFSSSLRSYDVSFVKNEAGWGSLSGTEIASVPYGQGITISGSTVSINGSSITATAADNTAEFTYGFSGWTKSPNDATVQGAMTITANFTRETNKYTVSFAAMTHGTISVKDAGENTINSGDDVDYGTVLTVTAVPDLGYEFSSWMSGTSASVTVTGNVSLGAVFAAESKPQIELFDDAAPQANSVATTNSDLLTDYAGAKSRDVDVTLYHNFTANIWNTICLPFDYDTEGDEALDGNVYELDNCITDNDAGMTITFSPIASQMTAGTPYLVWTEKTITALEFSNVRLQHFTPGTVAPNSSAEFRAVFEAGYLTRKSSIFIGSGNRLFYANAAANGGKGTRIRGYRGYFEILDEDFVTHYAQPRVRIVVNNPGQTVLTTDFEPETATRKYIENGILVIEREGVRYDAQGKKLD